MGFFKTMGRLAESAAAATVDFVTMDIDDTQSRRVRRRQDAEDQAESLKAVAEFIKVLKS